MVKRAGAGDPNEVVGTGRIFQKVRGRWVYYCCVRCKVTARMLDLRLSLVLGLILKPAEAFLASQDVQNLENTG